MTDEQKKARKISAESGHIKWIKDHCLRTMDDGEDYVFISYKSDDYEKVLDEILYETCRKYGLRVYFDVAFDDKSDSWITQFYDNMCSTHCKAMIAFISNKYYTSYATLLEMMARKTLDAGGDSEYDTLPFLPIIVEPITLPDGNRNTGLGTEYFSDGRENHHAAKELKKFNSIFKELVDLDDKSRIIRNIYKRFNDYNLYQEAIPQRKKPAKGKPYLTETQCHKLMKFVRPDSNDNDGSNKDLVEVIHDKLANGDCGDSVFIPGWKPVIDDGGDSHGPTLPEPSKPLVTQGTQESPKSQEPPKPQEIPKPQVLPISPKPQELQEKSISLPNFLKEYDNSTFKKDTFQRIRLVGQGGYAKYNSEFYLSTSRLVQDFVEGLLKERGEEYIHFVNGKNQGSKNPPFITEEMYQALGDKKRLYRKIDELLGVEGYFMYSNYSQYDWVNAVLCKRIKELGMRLEDFSLVYEDSTDPAPIPAKPETPVEAEEPEPSKEVTEGIIVLRDLNGKTHTTKKSTNAPDGYTFTLYGERHYEPKLKNLMLTVFKEAMSRHPDKLDQLVDKLACLSRDVEIHKDANPTTFRAGDYYIDKNDGQRIAIGTSMNQNQVLKSIGRLMQICGEPKENLGIVGYDY